MIYIHSPPGVLNVHISIRSFSKIWGNFIFVKFLMSFWVDFNKEIRDAFLQNDRGSSRYPTAGAFDISCIRGKWLHIKKFQKSSLLYNLYGQICKSPYNATGVLWTASLVVRAFLAFWGGVTSEGAPKGELRRQEQLEHRFLCIQSL